MKQALARICDLQSHYSADNTPSMAERGRLIRNEVRSGIEATGARLRAALGAFGSDFATDASDGIGRKTELPWVRFYSANMSPRPTEGFYGVLHFSTDGSAMHVTVGCGSSRFSGGSFVTLPDAKLDLQTRWARAVVLERYPDLVPFDDIPDFGARRKLTRSFQRATAMSCRVERDEIEHIDLNQLLEQAALRLRAIYEAQASGRDLSPGDLEELEIAQLLKPDSAAAKRQGMGLSAPARKAVERRAMNCAAEWLRSNGYTVRDCSANNPFDFIAKMGVTETKVEVKGTTSDLADSILMTRNEVDLHTKERGNTALLIVTKIRLQSEGESFKASGGEVEALVGWDINQWVLVPTAYRLARLSL